MPLPAGRSAQRWAVILAAAALLLLVGVWHQASLTPSFYGAAYGLPLSLPGSDFYFSDALTGDVAFILSLGMPATHGQFLYRRQCLRAVPVPTVARSLLVDLDIPFPSEADALEVDVSAGVVAASHGEIELPACQHTATVEVPAPDPVELRRPAPQLLLGISTTLLRIEQSLPGLARWLAHRGAPLVAVLHDVPDLAEVRQQLEHIREQAAWVGLEIIFEPYRGAPDDSLGLKNFALARALAAHLTPETTWCGVLDDDTFFVSLPRLLAQLEPFDARQHWYLGAMSEDTTRIEKAGYMAYGGAGFFLSRPLLEAVAASRECAEMRADTGDVLWRDCIFATTSPTVKLTELPGLNQMDFWVDAAGWYEGPQVAAGPPLSLHHWKSWHRFSLPEAHLVADIAGPDAFLQRYRLPGDTVLTNGYSVVQYPRGLPDLNLTELTMTEDQQIVRRPPPTTFAHALGRTRPALQEGAEKRSWRLEHAAKSPDGTVRQWYVRREEGAKPSVLEIDWLAG